MKNKKYGYIAGVCFGLLAFGYLTALITYGFYMRYVWEIIGLIIVTVSVFISQAKTVKIMQIIGIGLILIGQIYMWWLSVNYLGSYNYKYSYDKLPDKFNVIFNTIYVIYWILLFVGWLIQRQLKGFNLIAGIVATVGIILYFIYATQIKSQSNALNLSYVCMAIAAIMISMSIEQKRDSITITKSQNRKLLEKEKHDKDMEALERLDNRVDEVYDLRTANIYADNNEIFRINSKDKKNKNLIASKKGMYIVLTKNEFNKMYVEEMVFNRVGNNLQDLNSPEIYSEIEKATPVLQYIPFDNIQCFMKLGDVQYTSKVSGGGGGGYSLSGAIIGGLIGGDAGAIIGSRQSVKQVKTTVETHDTRKTQIRYLNGNGTMGIIEQEGYDLYDYLLRNIPEKDLLSLQLKRGTNVTPKTSEGNSRADRLRELKSLFDDGILTEEEFTTEKKKILNE